jgi:hypothetical protein
MPKFDVYLTARDVLQVFAMVDTLKTWPDVRQITIVDNASTFPEYLERLATVQDVAVIRCRNIGPRAAWSMVQFPAGQRYVVSDGDLDISELRPACLSQWDERLNERPELVKVGAALRLTDLPATELAAEVTRHELQFWADDAGHGYCAADIDTTFALYGRSGWTGYGPAERDISNQARHVLWYLEPGRMPADWRHYLSNVPNDRGTHWSLKLRTG